MMSLSAPYNKPSTTIPEQLKRLEERGMRIDNKKKAGFWLERVGYYRFCGYCYELREMDDSAPTPNRTEKFKPNSIFSEVVALYLFDEQLRLLILQAISPIEVALRAHIVRVLSIKNPQAYLDTSIFQRKFTQLKNGQTVSSYDNWLGKIHSSVEKSKKEPFIEHFFQKYCFPDDANAWQSMPLWIMGDCWDFGILSKCCTNLNFSYTNEIAKNFCSMPSPVLNSWLYTLNTARNCAAHHRRLWNRWWNVSCPKMPSKNDMSGFFSHILEKYKINTRIQATTYMVLAIIKFFLICTVEDKGKSWTSEIKSLLQQLPCVFGDAGKLGFPANWDKEALWNA